MTHGEPHLNLKSLTYTPGRHLGKGPKYLHLESLIRLKIPKFHNIQEI